MTPEKGTGSSPRRQLGSLEVLIATAGAGFMAAQGSQRNDVTVHVTLQVTCQRRGQGGEWGWGSGGKADHIHSFDTPQSTEQTQDKLENTTAAMCLLLMHVWYFKISKVFSPISPNEQRKSFQKEDGKFLE